MTGLLKFLYCFSFLLLAACSGGGKNVIVEALPDVPLRYAENITLKDAGDYTVAVVRNPWDTTKVLHTYILVPSDTEMPSDLPEGTVVRTPLESSLVYSSVHSSLISELGAGDAITGVCDAQYIHTQRLAERIDSGIIADCGSGMSPNIERIIELHPQAILLSPYENSGGYGKIEQLGIPLIECADYMETTPLGRAEWMKFYGMLYGRYDEAEKLFNETEHGYNSLKSAVDSIARRPKVMMDKKYGQAWYVPGVNSIVTHYLNDAGGANPFSVNENRSGSIALSPERGLAGAQDADIWRLRYNQADDMTLASLSADDAIYSQFEPWKRGVVYGCNTNYSHYYEEVPFHPHWLLNDLMRVIHPELSLTNPDWPHYFSIIK